MAQVYASTPDIQKALPDMWLDDFISVFSPRAAAKRIAWRSEIDRLRKYDGATMGRRGEGWMASSGSINQVNGTAIARLRERSRWIVRNVPYGKRAVENIALSVVGTGIRPAFTGSDAAIKRVKEAWKAWAESTHCDFDGHMNYYGLQRLAMRTVAESGECLIVKRYKKHDTLNPLQLQILEPEFLDTSKDDAIGFRPTNGEGFTLQGVEFDKSGRRVAYWLYDRHPSEFGNIQSTRVPAEDVIHVFDVLRPGQVRGVPFGVSGFLTTRDFSDLQDARLMKEKVAASWAAFVQDMANVDTTTTGAGGTKSVPLPDKLEPGAIEMLPPGKTITFPTTPSTEGYGDYSRTVKEGIAAAYGVTYADMTGDLTQVNFSSGRMGFISGQRLVEDWQLNMMIPKFCDGTFGWFMSAGFIALNLPRKVSASWTPPRRMMIDPDKETKAMNEAIRAGLNSWEEAARELGWDPEELKEQLRKQKAMWDEMGLMPTSDARFDPTRSDPNADPAGTDPAKPKKK